VKTVTIGTRNIKRGDIFALCIDTPEEESGYNFQPVLIVQSNFLNEKSETIVVATITTEIKKTFMSSHVVLGDDFGLREESMVMLEDLRSVKADDLIAYIGTVDDKEILGKIEIGLRDVLALSIRKQIKGDVRCLCLDCMENIKSRNLYFISRVDSFERTKYVCESCGKLGSRYLVVRNQYEKPVQEAKKSRKRRVG